MIPKECARIKGNRSGCAGRRTTGSLGTEYQLSARRHGSSLRRWDIEWGVGYIPVGKCCLSYSLSS